MAGGESSSLVERTKGLFLVVCCILATQTVLPVQGQILPTFDVCPSLDIPEDKNVGEKLFSIKARVNDGTFPADNLTFTLETATAELVNLTEAAFLNGTDDPWQWSSDVILRTPLDRDFEPSRRTLSFGATDTKKNTAVLICGMKITDVNDNAPSFQGLPYNLEVDELTKVGEVLRAGISATDPDTILGGQVKLYAQFSDPAVEQTFNTTTTQQGSGYVMDIILALPLDYEARTFYTFSIMAVDGLGLNTTAEVRVTVTDAQDTPPVFLLDTYRAAIREHQPVGTPVITVSAVDSDRDPPNGILYSIVQGPTDYFSIDNLTGSITSSVELDRDNVTMVDTEGVFELIVRATETDDVQPQMGNTTTEVEVVVVVEDINDHPPSFSRGSPYTGFVREDAPLGSLIYFDGDGYISVSDADQGRNSHFNLTVERDGVPWSVLQPTPTEVYLEAFVLLRVMQRDAFKELAGTHLSLQLVAREASTTERLSSTAEIVITVQGLPEPTTLPPPTLQEKITAPDIVVFIIGFLVIFNVVATACIIWYVRRSRRERQETSPRQGLARKGSKYYVNGVEKDSRRSSEFQNGSAVSLRSESILVEVDGKDRCDVVPLGNGATSEPRSPPTSSDAAAVAASTKAANGDVAIVRDVGQSTDRKVLISSEVAPAKSSLASLNSSADSLDRSLAAPGSSSASAGVASARDGLPNFSKAKRNVSAPRNPALSFSVPNLGSASNLPPPAPRPVSSVPSPASGTVTTPSASAESVTLEPVTRFSAKGAVSTTVAAVGVGQPASAPATVSSRSGKNETGREASTTTGKGSVAEILY